MSELPELFLEEALQQVRDGEDAIPAITAALDALRVECGELPESVLDELVDQRVVSECTCPFDLVARGGFVSTCPEHGTARV